MPDRDTGAWNANFESWRFIPNGATSTPPTFAWYENYVDEFNVGTLISANPNHVFSPLVDTTYTAEVRYTEACSGLEIVSTVDVNIILANELQGEIVEDATLTPIEDIFFCAGSGATFDVKAKVVFDPLVFFMDYQWREVSTNSIVSIQEIYTIDSAEIESAGNTTELYEVTMSLYLIGETPGVDVPICLISDVVNVVVGMPYFDFFNPIYCIDDINPVPQNILPFAGPGVFTINNGGFINVNTGEIDLSASGLGTDTTGNFTVTLTAGIVPNDCTFSFDITIEQFENPEFTYNETIYAIDGINPIPNFIATSGGIFTINNGATINAVTGEVDLTTTTINQTYNIVYTLDGSCSTSANFTITIVETLGIEEEILSNSISINPNPANGNFVLTNQDNIPLEKLELVSYLGKLLKIVDLKNTSLETQIDINTIESGIYFIRITNQNNNSITKKLIIN